MTSALWTDWTEWLFSRPDSGDMVFPPLPVFECADCGAVPISKWHLCPPTAEGTQP